MEIKRTLLRRFAASFLACALLVPSSSHAALMEGEAAEAGAAAVPASWMVAATNSDPSQTSLQDMPFFPALGIDANDSAAVLALARTMERAGLSLKEVARIKEVPRQIEAMGVATKIVLRKLVRTEARDNFSALRADEWRDLERLIPSRLVPQIERRIVINFCLVAQQQQHDWILERVRAAFPPEFYGDEDRLAALREEVERLPAPEFRDELHSFLFGNLPVGDSAMDRADRSRIEDTMEALAMAPNALDFFRDHLALEGQEGGDFRSFAGHLQSYVPGRKPSRVFLLRPGTDALFRSEGQTYRTREGAIVAVRPDGTFFERTLRTLHELFHAGDDGNIGVHLALELLVGEGGGDLARCLIEGYTQLRTEEQIRDWLKQPPQDAFAASLKESMARMFNPLDDFHLRVKLHTFFCENYYPDYVLFIERLILEMDGMEAIDQVVSHGQLLPLIRILKALGRRWEHAFRPLLHLEDGVLDQLPVIKESPK